MDPSKFVRLGVWYDYTDKPQLCLTSTRNSGYFLQSAIVLFITYVLTRLWSVLNYAIHQLGSHNKSRSIFVRQQDVILCNSSSPPGVISALVNLLWAWRKEPLGARPKWRAGFLIIVAILYVAGTIVASIYSSAVILGNRVSTDSPNCGIWYFDYQFNGSLSRDSTQLRYKRATDASVYAASCYPDTIGNNTTGVSLVEAIDIGSVPGLSQGKTPSAPCNKFVKPFINFSIKHNETCPFGDSLCSEGKTAAFSMDTGLFSSRDLGVNSKSVVGIRKRTVCSPLKRLFTVFPDPNGTYPPTDGLKYGGIRAPDAPANEPYSNTTYFYDTTLRYLVKDYEVAALFYEPYTDSLGIPLHNFWQPIRGLARQDASISVVFVFGNGVGYRERSFDPVFTSVNYTEAYFDGPYYPSKNFGVIGCTDQFQLCNTLSPGGQCSNLTHLQGALVDATADLGLSKEQLIISAAFREIFVTHATVSFEVDSSGARTLKARQYLSPGNGVSPGINREQWKIEVENWFKISLAGIQQDVAILGTGPESTDHRRFVNLYNASDPALKFLCSSIAVTNASYTTFSLTGVLVIFCVGIFITVLSFSLEPVLSILLWRFPSRRHAILAWRLDAYLQLHRLANRGAGVEGWYKGLVDTIPLSDSKKAALPRVKDGVPILVSGRWDPEYNGTSDIGSFDKLEELNEVERVPHAFENLPQDGNLAKRSNPYLASSVDDRMST